MEFKMKLSNSENFLAIVSIIIGLSFLPVKSYLPAIIWLLIGCSLISWQFIISNNFIIEHRLEIVIAWIISILLIALSLYQVIYDYNK
jgi:hypothetical protein